MSQTNPTRGPELTEVGRIYDRFTSPSLMPSGNNYPGDETTADRLDVEDLIDIPELGYLMVVAKRQEK